MDTCRACQSQKPSWNWPLLTSELQNSIFSHPGDPHCSGGDFYFSLNHPQGTQETTSLEFPFLQEAVFKERQSCDRNHKSLRFSDGNSFLLFSLRTLYCKQILTLTRAQHVGTMRENALCHTFRNYCQVHNALSETFLARYVLEFQKFKTLIKKSLQKLGQGGISFCYPEKLSLHLSLLFSPSEVCSISSPTLAASCPEVRQTSLWALLHLPLPSSVFIFFCLFSHQSFLSSFPCNPLGFF